MEKASAAETGANPYELINAQIATSPPAPTASCSFRTCWGSGRPRWNPDAKGALIGLTLAHTRADVLRAVMEGVTLNLSIILDIFRARTPITEITVIGGGAKGAVWRKIMADVYQADILKPNYLEEATSMGAAIIGGVGCGVFKDFDVADRFIQVTDRVSPDPAARRVYAEAKSLLNDSYDVPRSPVPEIRAEDATV